MSFPGSLPVWATVDALIAVPTTPKQQQGWTTSDNTPTGIGEKPPLQYFNWWMNLVYQWIDAISVAFGSITALGTMAAQNANAVAITGGTITGTNLNIPTGMAVPFFGITTGSGQILPSGFIPWRDGTIGNAASNGTILANANTVNLFTQIWNAANNTNCQLYSSAGSPVSRGANAAADYAANCALALPRANGMTPGISGTGNSQGGVTTTTRAFADLFGEETHVLTIPEMPSHDHDYQGLGGPVSIGGGSDAGPQTDTTTPTGGDGAHNNIQPTTWVNWIIKL